MRQTRTLERLEQIFEDFISHGLLFPWEANGKRYGHWTGSDQPGRLPPPSWRVRLERLAPPLPKAGLAAFLAAFSSSNIAQREGAPRSSFVTRENTRGAMQGGLGRSDSFPRAHELR